MFGFIVLFLLDFNWPPPEPSVAVLVTLGHGHLNIHVVFIQGRMDWWAAINVNVPHYDW